MRHRNYYYILFICLFFNGLSGLKAQWQPSPAPPGEDIEQIFFVNQQTGYVASHGYIFKTTNGGQNWSEIYHPGQINGSEIYYFRSMFFTSASTGYVVGQDFWAADYLVMRTQDGGQSWMPTAIDAGFNVGESIDVDFPNASTGFVATNLGRVLKTANGGNTWTVSNIAASNGAALRALDFPDSQNGYVLNLDSPVLYKTTNGGSSWQSVTLPKPFYDLQFFNYQIGVAGGQDGLYKTTDAGLTWTLISEKYSNGVQNLQFLDENTGFAFTGDGLCKTVDGGKTWHVQQVNIGYPASVNTGITCLSAVDAQTAWCGGYREETGNFFSLMVKTGNGGGLGVHLTLSDNLLECPGESITAMPSFIGVPDNVAWYVADTLFSTSNSPQTIPLPAPGNIPVRLDASAGGVSVSMERNVQVNGAFNYPGTTFTVNYPPCQGEKAKIFTNWNTNYGKLVIYQGANFVDTAKVIISPTQGKYFEVPGVYISTEYTIKVVNTVCHLDVTLSSVVVNPKPLPSVDFTLNTDQPVYCNSLQQLIVTQSGSVPSNGYTLFRDGIQEDSDNGNGGPLTYKITKTLDKPIHIWFRAFNNTTQCTAYSDTVLVPIDIMDANFSMNAINQSIGTPLELNFVGIPAAQYEWSFGDQADPPTSKLADPGPVQYNGAVNTAVQLITTGPFGCRDTVVRGVSRLDMNTLSPYWAMEMAPYVYGTANDIIVDQEGNVVINAESNFPKTYDMPSRAGAGSTIFSDQAILKYNRYGVLLWQLQHNSEFINTTRLQFDHGGNIVGLFEARDFSTGSTIWLGSTTKDPVKVYNEEKGLIVKWDADGNILWKTEVKTCNVAGLLPDDIALDDQNNIYGLFHTHNVPQTCSITIQNADSTQVQRTHPESFVVKFSPDGKYLSSFDVKTTNQAFWIGNKLGVDASKNVYVGAYNYNLLAKFNPAGALIWAMGPQTNTPAPQCNVHSMITDPAGNNYLIGDFKNTLKFGPKVIASSSPNADVFVAKIDSSGTLQWIKSALADNSIDAYPLALRDDKLYVGMDFQHQFQYPPLYLTMNFQLPSNKGAVWMQLNAGNGGVQAYKPLIEANPSIAYFSAYSNSYHGIDTDTAGNIYLAGINGYQAEWADTLLQSRGYMFLTRIAGFSNTVDANEAPEPGATFEAIVSPNPAQTGIASLRIKMAESRRIKAILTDIQGRQQWLFDQELPQGSSEYFMETPPPGVYILHLQGENGEYQSLKWVVTR